MGKQTDIVKQISWILRSYLSNKMFLAMLAGVGLWGMVVVVSLLESKSYQSFYPEAPRGNCVVNTLSSLNHVRRENMQDQVDYLQLGGIWRDMERQRRATTGEPAHAPQQVVSPPETFYDVLDEFPNLRIVYADLFNVDSRPALRRLAGRRGIEFLSLSGTAPLDMEAVAKIPSLKRLELYAEKPVHDIKKLASLANLETLVFTSERGVDDAVLRDIAQLPQLQTLVIRWNYFNQGITDAGIKQLDQSRSLKTFYVGGQRVPPEANLIVRGRALLSNVDVQPAVVPQRLPMVVGFFPAGLAMGIGMVVASQLTSPASRLAPGFLFAHTVTALGWLGMTILTMTLSLSASWQPFGQSVVLCSAAAMFFFSAGVDTASQRRFGFTARVTLWDWGVSLGVPILILSVMLPGALELAQQWRFALLAAAGAFAAAAAWHATTILQRLPGIQTADKVSQQDAAQNFLRANRHYLFARRERLVEKLSNVPVRRGLWMNLQRWRSGNAPLAIVPFVLMFLVGALPVAVTLQRARPETAFSLRAMLVFLPLFILLMIVGQIAVIWRRRITCLEVESLRPLSRSVIQRDWALAMLLDLLMPSALVGLVVAAASQLSLAELEFDAWPVALPRWQSALAAFVILTCALWMIAAAVCSLQVVIERQWVRLLIIVPLILLNATGVAVLLVYRTGVPARTLTSWDVLPLLWVPGILSLVVLAWMWRLWTRIDFDGRA